MKQLKRMALITAAVLMISVALSGFSVLAAGDFPDYESYMYSYDQTVKYGIVPYKTASVISSDVFGERSSVTDLAVASNGDIYILDTGKAEILRLSSDYQLIEIIDSFDNSGTEDRFLNPEGIFIRADGRIYIADTGNARVVILNKDYSLHSVIEEPDRKLSQLDYVYEPLKAVADGTGRMIVLARNQTQGCLQFNDKGEFMGYLGANRVTVDPVELFWRTFATKAQRENMKLFIPTEFNSIDMDAKGFLYATVGKINITELANDVLSNSDRVAPIRKINLQGKDILKRQSFAPPVGDLKFMDGTNKFLGASSLVDITVDSYGNYSVLDNLRGRVFTYNDEGELLYIFGSLGDGREQFVIPSAISYQDEKLLVLDKSKNTLHIFKPTEFAKSIFKAQGLKNSGDSDAELAAWRDILAQDSTYDAAYTAIGKLHLKQHNYKASMENLQKGENKEYYSKAFKEYRKQIGTQALLPVLSIVFLSLTVLYLYKLYKKRHPVARQPIIRHFNGKEKKLYKEIAYAKRLTFHPFDGFWDIKHEKRGSAKAATFILAATILSQAALLLFTGYLFRAAGKVNVLVSGFLGVLALVMLWVAANWALTTLMDGKGTLKDIYIYTCYCLTPLFFSNIVLIVLSNTLSLDEAAVYTAVSVAGIAWTGFLIFSGTLTTHDFSPVKAVMTIVLTFVAIGIILFLGVLVISLIQQITTFIQDIALEISIRS